MRIVDAEEQLVADILGELSVTESRERSTYTVYVGHHPLLGRMVVVQAKGGQGTIVEMD